MPTKTKKATGAARMRQLDYLPVQVWFKREALNRIAKAATAEGLSVATLVRESAEASAAAVLGKAKKR